MSDDDDWIYAYSITQAVEDAVAKAFGDGHLVDVSETASEAGFAKQVVLTRAVFDRCLRSWLDYSERLWDLLSTLRRVRNPRRWEGVQFELRLGGWVRRLLGRGDRVTLRATETQRLIVVMLPEENLSQVVRLVLPKREES